MTRIMSIAIPFLLFFIAKDFHRQEAYRARAGKNRCGDRNSHRTTVIHTPSKTLDEKDVRDGIN